MESIKALSFEELNPVEEASLQSPAAILELSDLQLAYVGGGSGDVVL